MLQNPKKPKKPLFFCVTKLKNSIMKRKTDPKSVRFNEEHLMSAFLYYKTNSAQKVVDLLLEEAYNRNKEWERKAAIKEMIELLTSEKPPQGLSGHQLATWKQEIDQKIKELHEKY